MSYLNEFKIKFTNIRVTDMPDKEYFAIPALSTSKLKLLDPSHGGSIEKYNEGFSSKYNAALELGSAIHNAILSPDEYIISDYICPVSAKLKLFIECLAKYRKNPETRKSALLLASEEADYYQGKLTDKVKLNAYKKGKDYYRRLMRGDFTAENNNGKVVMVLDEKLHTAWEESVKNLKEDYMFRKLMNNVPFEEEKEIINEMAFFCDIEVTFPDKSTYIVPYKGKADNIILDHEHKICYLNDIKTTSKGIGYFMPKVVEDVCYSGTFEHHDYYMQLAKLIGPLDWEI